MSNEIELPEGWRFVKISQICKKIVGGGTPSTKKVEYWNGNIPWISSADIFGLNEIVPRRKVTIEAIKNSTANILPKGGIIIVTRVGLGKIAIAPYDLSFSQDNQGLVLDEQIVTPSYALICLSRAVQEFKHNNRGTTISGVTKKQLTELQIPLPPIEEQRLIVGKIEELFSELDKGIENLKIAQQQLKVYRQAVLKWAFEGDYILTNLRELFDFIGGGTPSKKEAHYWNGLLSWASVKDIKGDYLNKTEDTITEEGLKNSAANVANPDDVILITRISPGKTIISNIRTAINQDLKIVKPKFQTSSKYVYYLFKSIERECVKLSSGTTVLGINLTNLKEIKVPLVDFATQQQIVQEIESRLSVCNKIEETLTASLQQAEALRQSILKQAFEGKLVKAQKVQQEAKIVSITSKRDDWQRKVLAGKIIYACHNDKSFGITKFQKTLYLCEQHAQLDFDTHYLKQTAGPLDQEFIYPFIREAKTNEWFIEDKTTTPHRFEPLSGIGDLTSQYVDYFEPVADKINFVIKLLQGKNTVEAELIATIYAVWNNYLIEGTALSGDALIAEVYDWSESKIKFWKNNILSTWQWMQTVGLVPVAFGELINKKINTI